MEFTRQMEFYHCILLKFLIKNDIFQVQKSLVSQTINHKFQLDQYNYIKMVKNICILALALVILAQAGHQTTNIITNRTTVKESNETHPAVNSTQNQSKPASVTVQPTYKGIVQITSFSSFVPFKIIPVTGQNASSKETSNTTINSTLYQLKQHHTNWTKRNSSKWSNASRVNSTIVTVKTVSTTTNVVDSSPVKTSSNDSNSSTGVKTGSTTTNSYITSANSIFYQNPFNIRYIPPTVNTKPIQNSTVNKTQTNHTLGNFTHSNSTKNKTISVPVNFTIVFSTTKPLNITQLPGTKGSSDKAADPNGNHSSSNGSTSSSNGSSSSSSSATSSSSSGSSSSSATSSSSVTDSSVKESTPAPNTNQNFKYTLTPLKCTCDADCQKTFVLAKLFLIKVACDTKNSICIRAN